MPLDPRGAARGGGGAVNGARATAEVAPGIDAGTACDEPLFGLVLCGGRSRRMGRDKGRIIYHPPRSALRRTVDLLAGVCDAVYLSLRADQQLPADAAALPRIDDRYPNYGPIGGIASAFLAHPAAAWFVVACDMPLLSRVFLQRLIGARDGARTATCAGYRSDAGPYGSHLHPEPLCAIWEPAAATVLASALESGERSPRRVLERLSTTIIEPSDSRELLNANTPSEAALAAQEIAAM